MTDRPRPSFFVSLVGWALLGASWVTGPSPDGLALAVLAIVVFGANLWRSLP